MVEENGTDTDDNDKNNGNEKPSALSSLGRIIEQANRDYEESIKDDPVMREVQKRAAQFPNLSDLPPKAQRLARFATAAALASSAILIEARTGMIESLIFPPLAKSNSYQVVERPAFRTATPPEGIYDQKAGYTRGEIFDDRLQKDFNLVAQAELRGLDGSLLGLRFAYPVYDTKPQVGLKIFDATNKPIYDARFPQQIYEKFDDLPSFLIKSLLYVESREVLDDSFSTRNHAVEIDRLFFATLGKIGFISTSAGGGTLGTQLEKTRHSPDGRTDGDVFEKMRQIITASERTYKNGRSTVETGRQTVVDYINAMPLSADPAFGEVNGYAVGMRAWFGEDIAEVNRVLSVPQAEISDRDLPKAAKIYRETLALIMAVKKPTAFIRKDRAGLEKRIDAFLPALESNGVITPRMKEAIANQRLSFAPPVPLPAQANLYGLKSVTSLRIEFMQTLGTKAVTDLGDLDHMDFHLKTTHDGAVSNAVQKRVLSLSDPDAAKESRILGYRLLNEGQESGVIYSVSVTENTPDAVVQRVQVDNFGGQLNLSENSKLQLGSTSKARTVDLSLKLFEDLYREYSGMSTAELRAIKVAPKDRMTRWAIDYLASPDKDKSLDAFLAATLERSYPASPYEPFFTGGGVHYFENFEPKDNGESFTIRQALAGSINLPITRLGQDIVSHTIYHTMKTDPAIFSDPHHPARKEYLDRFALREGKEFLQDAWKYLKGKNAGEMMAALAAKTHRTPAHLAIIHRTVVPEASLSDFESFIRKEAKALSPNTDFEKLYENYAPEKFSLAMERDKLSLQDRGYVTGIDPLALWLAAHQAQGGKAPEWSSKEWDDAVSSSAGARIAVYQWLMKPGKTGAQNNRIFTALEEDAFTRIHAEYKKTGYPFRELVPSLATFAMGVSGDTPAALAKFMSIHQNGGVMKPVVRFTGVDFATGTPYERRYEAKIPESVRVRSPEVSRAVLSALKNVVDNGTARRLKGKFTLSDGRELDVYAKTGTGDNRIERRASNGGLISSNAVDRTATVMVGIGDKFSMTVLAYVNDGAGQYKFTSSLPLQVAATIAEDLRPMIERAYGIDKDKAPAQKTATKAPEPPPAPKL